MTFHYERRLDRALHHLESLKAEMSIWADESPYRIWSEFDADGRHKNAWVEVLTQPPVHLSLIVGDCIHNFRAALDNLALELAIAYKRGPVSKSIESDSGFPIFATCSEKNLKELDKMLRGVDPRAKAIIEGLQPYKRGDGFRSDSLWQLHWLDIEDKHRLPHVVLFAQSGSGFFIPDNLTADDIEFSFRPIEDRAPIARYPAFDKTGAEVDMQITPVSSVGFGQRVPQTFRGVPVPTKLKGIHFHILDKVIQPLRPFLKPH